MDFCREAVVKKLRFVLTLFILSLASNLYAQTVIIRPGSSIGYCTADDVKGLTYTYGLKILLMSNDFQRYGIKIDHYNILADDKHSYLSAGLFIRKSGLIPRGLPRLKGVKTWEVRY
jgi:hypothetical protein